MHCVMNISTQHADQQDAVRELDNLLITGGADCKVHVWDLRNPCDSRGSRFGEGS